MINRRQVLQSGMGAFLSATLPSPLLAAEVVEYSGDLPTAAEIKRSLETFGTGCPYGKEYQDAREYLSKIVVDDKSTPLDVMTAMEQWTYQSGDANHLYNSAWPDRWNPVIVTFLNFVKEGDKKHPSDAVAWCAASLNWVLALCGLQGTDSSGSQSFLDAKFGFESTKTPKAGDIVVFRHNNNHDHGHVSIYLSDAGNGMINVLGGNQLFQGTREFHRIKRKAMPTKGSMPAIAYLSIGSFKKTTAQRYLLPDTSSCHSSTVHLNLPTQ